MLRVYRFLLVFLLLFVADVAQSADTAVSSANDVVATAPTATRPAESVVLVRFGDGATLTQAEFNKNARGYAPGRYDTIMTNLTRDKLFLLYIQDHPELVPARALEDAIDTAVFENRTKSREELEQKLHERGLTWDEMQERLLIGKAVAAKIEEGEKNGKDEKYMRKRFEDNPADFDGTTVSARHIQKTIYPYDTPAEREEKRAQLAKIRADLVSNKIKWNDAVQESDYGSKLNGGNLGSFERHIMITETVAEQAFKLKVGELSEIVESDLGFHIIEVLGRQPGNRKFEDNETQKALHHWLEAEPLQIALREARAKYPVIGVEPPSPPPPLVRVPATAPAVAQTPSSQPVFRSKARFQDANSPQPKKQAPVKIKPVKP